MKILYITPYLTSKSHPAFMRNQTGFGYMVHDIAENVGVFENVDVFSVMTFTPSMELDGFHVIGHSWLKWLKNIRWQNIKDGLYFIRKYPQTWKNLLRTLYIFTAIGQVEKIFNRYDVVHIHGCSSITDASIVACHRQRVKFLVTLHGLNSFEKSIKLSNVMKQYEKNFLVEAAKKEWFMSFISTGNKNTAENYVKSVYNKGISCNFHVINNGCNINVQPQIEDIRKIYHIDNDQFVFVFVGNISENKNQIQVVRSWMLLSDEDKKKCRVLFVGNYKKSDEIVNYIQHYHLQSELILCGMQPKNRISQFYQAANATVLTSLSEGFGLSIIEGMAYGVPCLTFADLSAIADLYDERAMVTIQTRSDQDVAESIHTMMSKSWNRVWIKEYAKRFSFENMAKKYDELYKDIKEGRV